MSSTKGPDHYDLLVIGSGEAGKFVPWILSAKHGKKTAVIERGRVGGSCPNVACLPSKNVIHSAAIAHEVRRASAFGVSLSGIDPASLKSDMPVVKARKDAMVKDVNGFQGFFDMFGVEIIRGEGTFVGPNEIQVDGGRVLTADHVLICTGSRARVDARIPGLLEARPMTHIELLDLDVLPAHLIIIGGGYVGVEFAQAYARLGSHVTLVQRGDQLIPREDEDVVQALSGILAKEGVRIITSADVQSASGTNGEEVTVSIRSSPGGEEEVLRGSHILMATGRIPNTADLNLDAAGIKTTAAGHIVVDEQLRASASVFAAGDCTGSPHFTHMGFDDFRVIYNHLTGSPREGGTLGRQVPSVLFTDPELARVGLTEKEARAKGVPYRLAKLPMASFLRTRTLGPGASEGFAKALIEADGERILGFTALGPGAGELLPVISLAMKLNAGYRQLADLIIAHPTMNEGLVELFLLHVPDGTS
ncbi:uncharacterized protein PG998_010181 [Apiospora kogelbergensis]|uniref:uncharacterized protein n=1 Tax=Apiospora kogelbergensis TaxID=1337665 RepID=UPI0031321DF1